MTDDNRPVDEAQEKARGHISEAKRLLRLYVALAWFAFVLLIYLMGIHNGMDVERRHPHREASRH